MDSIYSPAWADERPQARMAEDSQTIQRQIDLYCRAIFRERPGSHYLRPGQILEGGISAFMDGTFLHIASTGVGAKRILVAEDHPEWRTLLRLILSDAGYEVTITESGEKAVEAAPFVLPDIVLLGLGHWKTKALEVARRMREVLKNRVPILLISTDLPTDRQLQGDEHFDGYMHKDDVICGLVDYVDEHLKDHSTPGGDA